MRADATLDGQFWRGEVNVPAPEPVHDLVVLSDLHLGRGMDVETGRYHRLETFFYDDDFKRFCRYLCQDSVARGVPFKLVLNGDVFDLLRIEPEEVDAVSKARERRYGPTLTPSVAARILAQILQGHPGFVEALALVVAAGYEVILLPGNHDLELQWVPVQDELRGAVHAELARTHGERVADTAVVRLVFKPWFHHEEGRIWIEHGCQYDPENAFRYPLRAPLVNKPDEVFHSEQDMPFGNFVQRYLYNAFGSLTFIVPSTRANARYVKWLLVNQPRLMMSVLASHVPFALQLLRRLSRAGKSQRNEFAEAHAQELARLAHESGLGARLVAIGELKHVGADVVRVGTEAIRQFIRLSLLGLAVTLIGGAAWAMGARAIDELKVGLAPRALLTVLLNSFVVVVLASWAFYSLFRSQPPSEPWPLRRAASRIAEMLEVPLVAFGHTHDEVIARLPSMQAERGWYFNTGTWIAVFTHDVLLPRDRVQFTFLRVRGRQGALLHWSPGRGEPMPVILLDEPSSEAPGPSLRPPGASLAA